MNILWADEVCTFISAAQTQAAVSV